MAFAATRPKASSRHAPRSRWILWLALLGLIAAAFFGRSLWLGALGRFLVHSEEPYKADLIVVLAGDGRGNRILKAAELVRQGWASKILVSGPEGLFGEPESSYAIAFAIKKGHPPDWFIPLVSRALTTVEEAAVVIPELRRRKVSRFLLVTSDYHSSRAARVYRAAAGDLQFRLVTSRDWAFRPDTWWHTREGQKQFFLEMSKTVAYALGI